MSALRLPAYGRELLQLRKEGLVPATMVVVSLDTWAYGKAYSRVVVPNDLQLEQVDFSFVAGLDVVLVYDSKHSTVHRRDAAVRQILRFDPVTLHYVGMGKVIDWLWIKPRRHGVERSEYTQ